MEENTSFWNKTTEELTVADQMKVIVIVPLVAIAAWTMPLIIMGKAIERKDRRKLKKQAKLAIVEDTTDEA